MPMLASSLAAGLGVVARKLGLTCLALIFLASIAVVAPPAATAYCGQYYPCYELEIEALSPPIGTSFEEGQEGPWVMIAAHGLNFVHVNVSTSPQAGSDGHTLSDLYRADSFYFFESGTDE